MAAAAAAVVNALLWPLTVLTSDPPQCFSYFRYAVPCGHGLSTWGALAAAVVIGVIVNVLVRHVDNRILSRTLTVLGLAVIVAYAVQTVFLMA
jgi:ABC-type glycerol-3-phosphate transport system permease component